ncbi:hypothetical protein TWF281_001207 [Arthrobotrys megalospora]
MASIANQEDIPSSLDPLHNTPTLERRSPNRSNLGSIPILTPPIFRATDETPPKSHIKSPIHSSFPLAGLLSHLTSTPRFDTTGIDVLTSGTRQSQPNIQFPENINPDHKSIIEGILKTNWSPGKMEGEEHSIMMDHSGIPLDSPPPLATSTPVPISILPADQTGWEAATIKAGGPDTAKRVYEQEEIWQPTNPLRSGDLFYDRKVKLFENYNQEKEGEEKEDNQATPQDATMFEDIIFVAENTDESQDIEMEDVPVPVPTTPTAGLRRAVSQNAAQSTVKKAPPLEDIKVFPQTEPRKPLKGILKSSLPPLDASGLRGVKKGTGAPHRQWGWYDSRSFSPLESSGELMEIAAKKAAKGGKGGKKKVQIDETVDERILTSSASEDEGPRRRGKVKNYKEDDDDGSDFEGSDDAEAPAKKTKATNQKRGGGRKPKKKKESSDEEEEQGEEQQEEEEKPEPKKRGRTQGAPKNGKKMQKNEDAGAFKPDRDSSDIEEEYETSKPKRGRKAAEVAEAVDNEEDGEGEEGEVGSDAGTGRGSDDGDASEEESRSEGEEEGQQEDNNNAEPGSSDSGGSDNNDQSGSEQEQEDEESDNGEEEGEEEYVEEEQAAAVRTAKPKKSTHSKSKATPPPQPQVSKTSTAKDYDRSMMKRKSIEGQRSKTSSGQSGLRKVQADKAFEIQEQFKRDGSLREVQLSGFSPSQAGWDDGRKELAPPAPPAFKFPEPPLTSDAPKIVESADEDDSSDNSNKTRSKSKDEDEDKTQIESVFPITRREIQSVKTLIERAKKYYDEASSREDDYLGQLGEARYRQRLMARKIKWLKRKLATTKENCSNLELELAAMRSIGHDNQSHLFTRTMEVTMYLDGDYPEHNNGHSGPSTSEGVELTALEVQAFEHPPFSSKLSNNPFRHKDMYHRREIINKLTFPGNVMLAEYDTDYYFICCECYEMSDVKLAFYQDELIWSSNLCSMCLGHQCCDKCTRWTSPASSSRWPETFQSEQLLNGPKAKENYESTMYLKGIWADYMRQREEAVDSGLPPKLQEEDDPHNQARRAAAQAGLRSTESSKRKNEDDGPGSKRRRIEEKRVEILEERSRSRRPPVPEEEEGEREREGEEEGGGKEGTTAGGGGGGGGEREEFDEEVVVAGAEGQAEYVRDAYVEENDDGQFTDYD